MIFLQLALSPEHWAPIYHWRFINNFIVSLRLRSCRWACVCVYVGSKQGTKQREERVSKLYQLWPLLRNLISSLTIAIHNIFNFKQRRMRNDEHREQWRRAKSHGQGFIDSPLLFLNISSSIRLLMVRFFSCVIFAHRIISGWLLFVIPSCSFDLIAVVAIRSESVHSSS